MIEKLFGNLKISRKLTLICGTFLLPIAVLLYSTITTIDKDVDFAQSEIHGNRYQRPLETLLEMVPESMELARRFLTSARQDKEALAAKQGQTDRAFDELEREDQAVGAVLQFTDEGLGKRHREHVRVENVRAEWEALKAQQDSLAPATSDERHRHLVEDIRTMITHAGDASNLILDPDLDTYYTMDATLLALPQTQDRLSRIIRDGHALLETNSISAKDRVQMAVHAAQLKEADLDRVTGSLKTALNEDQNFYGVSTSFQQNVPGILEDYQAKTEAFAQLSAQMATEGVDPVPVQRFEQTGAAARAASFALWTVASDEMDAMLQTRIDVLEQRKNVIFIATLATLAVSVLLAFLIARNITRPIYDFIGILGAQTAMDFTRKVRVDRSDELGRIGQSLNTMADSLGTFIAEISSKAKALALASEEFSSLSHRMTSNAEETAHQANVVSAASRQISKNIQTVAAGSEEMTASIKEIARNAAEGAKVAGQAVHVASQTSQTISQLDKSSTDIGNVIKAITAIAEQTNLLALNATIEAARAGEAGKGFAVVANEVKELASETARATEDIGRKITAIQSDTKGSVEAITRVGAVISQISDIQNTIASAVEEQAATTNEIGRNVSDAAKGSADIAQNITGVAKAAQDTSGGAANIQALADNLARMAVDLQTLVAQFKVESRHA